MSSELPEEPLPGVKIRPWLKQLYRHVRSLKLSGDGKTVRISRADNGTTLTVLTQGPGGGGGVFGGDGLFQGFFRVDNATEKDGKPQITVTDGSETLGGYAGVYVSGIDTVMVPTKIIPVTSTAFIVLQATYNAEKWTVEIEPSPAFPKFTADRFTAVLAHVTITDGKLAAIKQIWNNGVIYNNRYS